MYYCFNGFLDGTAMTKILQYKVPQYIFLRFEHLQPLPCPFHARSISSHTTNPYISPVRHGSVAGEWLAGATGGGVLQEDRQEGEQEDEEGVKVKRVYRR